MPSPPSLYVHMPSGRSEQQPHRGEYSVQSACYYAKPLMIVFTSDSFLADNNFTGSIPDSLSSLTLLKAMSLNDNFLSGEIPDAFQALPGLVNLDLSNNNLSGQLPSSFIDLASLTTLRLQDNQLSGSLDVLQDLPLRDLNVENNLFSGPIPDKLLAIPNFRNDGNPFNTSSAPLPAPTSSSPSPPTPTPPLSGAPPSPSSRRTPGKQADGPSSSEKSSSGGKNKRVVWISIAGVLLFVILALALVLLIPRCSRRRWEDSRIFKRHQVGENPRDNGSLVQATNQNEKGKQLFNLNHLLPCKISLLLIADMF
ncbi:hypothetical protein POTOM_045833 [Populus tomentosa]|uniref:Uncharacterized protein n=1 Tax=Populus tomentosa TaxID=118781 RepID=A0A8X7YIH3_POPTO|nr:hypothetical protein POTOM_045833 [Populus tomentosa]